MTHEYGTVQSDADVILAFFNGREETCIHKSTASAVRAVTLDARESPHTRA